jgi:hypothetical protein
LFAARSEFLEAAFKRWDAKLAHLDTEVLDLAGTLMRPIYDTPAQRRTTADALNKVHLESIDNKGLGTLLQKLKVKAGGDGSLKRIEALLGTTGEVADVQTLLSPFYALYDFRVAQSHLGSKAGQVARMKTVTDRLGLQEGAPLQEIYDALICGMTNSYKGLIGLVKVEEADSDSARDA